MQRLLTALQDLTACTHPAEYRITVSMNTARGAVLRLAPGLAGTVPRLNGEQCALCGAGVRGAESMRNPLVDDVVQAYAHMQRYKGVIPDRARKAPRAAEVEREQVARSVGEGTSAPLVTLENARRGVVKAHEQVAKLRAMNGDTAPMVAWCVDLLTHLDESLDRIDYAMSLLAADAAATSAQQARKLAAEARMVDAPGTPDEE